ncbi:MAG TPA: phosphotransferase, partial [Patescibacteria group bacterium]|nr:phosphotransferase [Patescibacteria group bacterium]
AVRDGKTRYLQHLPRLADYIRRGLEDPLLAPLAQWFGEQNMPFEKSPTIDPAALRRLIRSDAF